MAQRDERSRRTGSGEGGHRTRSPHRNQARRTQGNGTKRTQGTAAARSQSPAASKTAGRTGASAAAGGGSGKSQGYNAYRSGKNGKKKVVERKLLPCYVFIKMIYSNQVWYLVTNTRGVTGFVGPQGRPLPLKDEEVRKMQLETVVVNADFAVGDDVSIDAGPLAGFVGKIKELNDSAQKAKVNVVMFGRNTDVEVEYVQIKKLNLTETPKEE